MTELQQIDEAARFISQQTGVRPTIGLIVDADLKGLAGRLRESSVIETASIPHFGWNQKTDALSSLILGLLFGKPVVMLHGRKRYFQGKSLQEITFPIRVMKRLGATHLILIDGVGSLNRKMKIGDLMAVSDHLNLIGNNPLIGHNLNDLGPRFPDMSEPYSHALATRAIKAARELNITLHEGIYAALTGPHLETNAEHRMLEKLGADAVGYATVPETIVANHMGMAVLALTVITDECYGQDTKSKTPDDILKAVHDAEPHFEAIIQKVIESL